MHKDITIDPRRGYKELPVKSSNCCQWSFLLLPLLVFGIAAPGIAGDLTDQIKQTTDKILSILSDPTLKESPRTEERERLIRKTLDERFDWEEMASKFLSLVSARPTPAEGASTTPTTDAWWSCSHRCNPTRETR